MIKSPIICLILAISLFSTLTTVRSCSCLRQTPKENFDRAHLVFTGKVTRIQQTDERHYSVTFAAGTKWKAPSPYHYRKNIKVYTATSSAMCGYNFEKGKTYLLYANKNGNKLNVTLCSRTRLIENACEDLIFLASKDNY